MKSNNNFPFFKFLGIIGSWVLFSVVCFIGGFHFQNTVSSHPIVLPAVFFIWLAGTAVVQRKLDNLKNN